MFFSLFRQRERTKRDHVARFRLDKISILRTVLRDSLRSNRSSHLLRSRTQSLYFLATSPAIATLRAPSNSPEGGGRCEETSFRPPSRNLIRVLPQQIADQVRDEDYS